MTNITVDDLHYGIVYLLPTAELECTIANNITLERIILEETAERTFKSSHESRTTPSFST